MSTSKSKNELDKLEAEYQLSFSIFNQISKELEAKKIEVQKEIPIFTILEPTIVPLSHKYPNRISILLLTIFYGITFSIIIIYLSTFYESNFKI